MGYPCFLLESIGKIRVWARRYGNGSPNTCPKRPGKWSYHDAMNLIGDFDFPSPANGEYEQWTEFLESIRPPADHPIWPTVCECGASLDAQHERGGQMFAHRIYERSDNGGVTTIREAPAGAMWYAWWMLHEGQYHEWDNCTEAPLMCQTPGGDWNIDSRASNCTLKEDRKHRCWIRHGTPGTPTFTVDKNGLTCAAGAGSILCGSYHGFLHNGELTS